MPEVGGRTLRRRVMRRPVVRNRAFPRASRPGGRSGKVRLFVALAVAAFALISYFGSSAYNPVTGEKQYVNISPDQEVALGLQAAPEMARRHGGLHPNREAQAIVDKVGRNLISRTTAAQVEYPYEFHLLSDRETVNAFALPGGQVFITGALYGRLQTEGQLAGVIGHEIGHVVARHGAEHIAKGKLTQGLTGAVVMATYDPTDPRTQGTAQIAVIVGQLVNMRFGRDDELESDRLGVRFMAEAGYDPRAMIQVMRILAEASGSGRGPEFFSTHPNPENRIARIEQAIREEFPRGVPEGLIP